MEVTSWTEFYEAWRGKLWQSIEDGSWRTLQVTNPADGSSTTFQSLKDVSDFLNEIEDKARAEEAMAKVSPYKPIRLAQRTSNR